MIVNVFVVFHECGIVRLVLLQLTQGRTVRDMFSSSLQPKKQKSWSFSRRCTLRLSQMEDPNGTIIIPEGRRVSLFWPLSLFSDREEGGGVPSGLSLPFRLGFAMQFVLVMFCFWSWSADGCRVNFIIKE